MAESLEVGKASTAFVLLERNAERHGKANVARSTVSFLPGLTGLL